MHLLGPVFLLFPLLAASPGLGSTAHLLGPVFLLFPLLAASPGLGLDHALPQQPVFGLKLLGEVHGVIDEARTSVWFTLVIVVVMLDSIMSTKPTVALYRLVRLVKESSTCTRWVSTDATSFWTATTSLCWAVTRDCKAVIWLSNAVTLAARSSLIASKRPIWV